MAGAFASLVARNRRRYGGYVVHAAIVLLAIGDRRLERLRHVARGEARARASRCAVGGYTLTYRALEQREARERDRDRARASTSTATASSSATVEPGKNRYPAEQQVSNEVGDPHELAHAARTSFVIADQVERRTARVYFKVLVKPLVNLIWLAGLVFLARLARRALAGRARAAPPRRALRRRRRARHDA